MDSPDALTPRLSDATVADLDVAFRAGTLTSERLVGMYLARIEAYDRAGPALNAVLTVAPDALEQARGLDRERRHAAHDRHSMASRWYSRTVGDGGKRPEDFDAVPARE